MSLFKSTPGRRTSPVKPDVRQKLDEVVLGVRAVRQSLAAAGCSLEHGNWLRMIRQATGMPVQAITERMGISKWELFRLEKAEWSSRIQLTSLRRAAAAMDCELVYAIVPQKGRLEDLAMAQLQKLEAVRDLARRKNKALSTQVNVALDWERVMNRAVRSELRKMGIRVR
jgi:transcriptional regulator with XRE-family HTH domain